MKLNKEQKALRKDLLQILNASHGFIISHENGSTNCFLPEFVGSNVFLMSCAILHPNDRYSRKYGEFIALKRMFCKDSEFIKISREMVYHLEKMQD